jgi:arylsulfatase A-like enzyme
MKSIGRLFTVLVCLSTACGKPVEAHSAPNVVFIVIDTLRAVDLPLDGISPESAPFLDALARESMVFDNAFSASSWTAPATASIFTSRHPNEHGVTQGLMATKKAQKKGLQLELNQVPQTIESLPVFMQNQGYRTFGVTANINIGEPMGFHRGFDRFQLIRGFGETNAGDVHEQLMTWKDEIKASPQAFIYLHLMDPHEPYERHTAWVDEEAPVPDDRMDDHVAYRSEIRNVDEYLRRMLEELDLGDDTIIILTADHGQEFGEHGGNGHVMSLYSELTHVPMMLHVGKDGPKGTSSANVSNMDLLPTLRELLATPADPAERGVSLLGILEQSERGERPLFSMRTVQHGKELRHIRSILQGPYKAIHHLRNDRKMLFNIDADPAEKKNIASQHPELLASLLEQMDQQEKLARLSSITEAGVQSLSADDVERLQMIGYTGE